MLNETAGWKDFLALCLMTKDEKMLDMLFDLLFTLEEKSDLALRFLIIKELIQNKKTQRDMAKDLKVSIAKITRGSNALKRISPDVVRFLEDLFNMSS